jgi:hypothetical protein
VDHGLPCGDATVINSGSNVPAHEIYGEIWQMFARG